MIRWRVTLAALAAVAACSSFALTVRLVEPGVLAVKTAPGATLEVLDWGGTGPALVFLAGGATRLTNSMSLRVKAQILHRWALVSSLVGRAVFGSIAGFLVA